MLVLNREVGQPLHLEDSFVLTVLATWRQQAKLAIRAKRPHEESNGLLEVRVNGSAYYMRRRHEGTTLVLYRGVGDSIQIDDLFVVRLLTIDRGSVRFMIEICEQADCA